MITKEIPATVRTVFGKGPMRRLRDAGKTPAIVYGGGSETQALEFETKVLFNELLDIQGRNAVITLRIDDGTEKKVLVKEIQTEPVKDVLYHADFLELDIDKPAQFSVPITYTGLAKGVDLGGILHVEKTEVLLKGLPLAIPDECTINLDPLAIGDKVVAGDLAIPDGIELLNDPEMVCVAIIKP